MVDGVDDWGPRPLCPHCFEPQPEDIEASFDAPATCDTCRGRFAVVRRDGFYRSSPAKKAWAWALTYPSLRFQTEAYRPGPAVPLVRRHVPPCARVALTYCGTCGIWTETYVADYGCPVIGCHGWRRFDIGGCDVRGILPFGTHLPGTDIFFKVGLDWWVIRASQAMTSALCALKGGDLADLDPRYPLWEQIISLWRTPALEDNP